MNEGLSCVWCERLFRPRKNGGRSQRFCRPSCRRAFHAAARTWALDELAAGRVTVADLKNRLHCNAHVASRGRRGDADRTHRGAILLTLEILPHAVGDLIGVDWLLRLVAATTMLSPVRLSGLASGRSSWG
jgi:hypothetical protein